MTLPDVASIPTTGRFLLGTHQPGWLADPRVEAGAVSLFVSDRRLRANRRLPVAQARWALDSGGFTELSTFGSWEHGPSVATYANRVRRYRDEIGQLCWAAPQDWMCEPFITAKSGLSVTEHQVRTVANVQELRALAPDLPWIPVVQGWTAADYLRCVDRYDAAGVDLRHEPLVGLGSVCRRQGSREALHIVGALRAVGIRRLHGFGVKVTGLRLYGSLLTSADSLAWSYAARRRPPMPGCAIRHLNCANCLDYALQWRGRLIAGLARPVQLSLFDPAEDLPAHGGAA